MKKIALITSKQWYRCSREDLYLEQQLVQAGFLPEIVCWTDQRQWEQYDLVILRSVWDYHCQYEAFCNWLRKLKQNGTVLANGVERILQNINKPIQLQQLTSCPVPPICSVICSRTEEVCLALDTIKHPQVVVKPGVSASGYNTFLIDRTSDSWEEQLKGLVQLILEESFHVIVQPFVPSVKNGEVSLIYFRGKLSHGVLRFPGVLAQKKNAMPFEHIPSAFVQAGQKVLHHIGGEEMLYLRIDLIEQEEQIYVMEVEAAEPDLYLSLDYSRQEPPVLHFMDAIDWIT